MARIAGVNIPNNAHIVIGRFVKLLMFLVVLKLKILMSHN